MLNKSFVYMEDCLPLFKAFAILGEVLVIVL